MDRLNRVNRPDDVVGVARGAATFIEVAKQAAADTTREAVRANDRYAHRWSYFFWSLLGWLLPVGGMWLGVVWRARMMAPLFYLWMVACGFVALFAFATWIYYALLVIKK